MFGADTRRCVTFSEYVAIRWRGSTIGPFYTACYTSWGQVRDVLQVNNNVYVKTNNFATPSLSYPLDGITGCDSCLGYLSRQGNNNYYSVDLGGYVKVKKFIIATYRYQYFRNVFIYLGNSSDFEIGGVNIYSLGSSDGNYKVFKREISNPITGRYFIVVGGTTSDVLEICELQVIRL